MDLKVVEDCNYFSTIILSMTSSSVMFQEISISCRKTKNDVADYCPLESILTKFNWSSLKTITLYLNLNFIDGWKIPFVNILPNHFKIWMFMIKDLAKVIGIVALSFLENTDKNINLRLLVKKHVIKIVRPQ